MKHPLEYLQKYIILTLLISSITHSIIQGQCLFGDHILVEEVQIGNLITWRMQCEQDDVRVLIQKSTDGVSFHTIGDLGSTPLDGPEAEFRYLDFALGSPNSYYRIQCQTSDGSSMSTPTLYLNRASPNQFSISGMSPTATDSYFNFTVRSTIEAEGHLQLWRFEPRELITSIPIVLIPGSNLLSIDFADLEMGPYLLALTSGDETEEVVLQRVAPKDIIATSYMVRD
jgi:hypothetical protein